MNYTDEQLNNIIESQLCLEIIEIQQILKTELSKEKINILKKRITSEVYLWYR